MPFAGDFDSPAAQTFHRIAEKCAAKMNSGPTNQKGVCPWNSKLPP